MTYTIMQRKKMENNIALTVIIPVYNAASDLPRCLDSVCHQSLQNMEIICVNDGSTDDSAQILNRYAKDDSRFKIITQKNQGLSAARNAGLEAVQGEYVFFLDADDWLHPQTLEIFYQTAQKNAAPVVVGETFCRLGKDIPKLQSYNIEKMRSIIRRPALQNLYKHRHVSAVAWNKLYRADIVKNRRFINGIFFEDWPFTTCLFADIDCYAVVKQPLYMYNTSSVSITRSCFSLKKINDYMTGIRYVAQYFAVPEKQNLWRLVQKKRLALSVKMMLSKISKSKENQAELENFFKKEYLNLQKEKIICKKDLSIKSLFRLYRLLWHQRCR